MFHKNLNSLALTVSRTPLGIQQFEKECTNWGIPKNFMINTLSYRVNAIDFHMWRLDCSFWIFRLKLKLLLPTSSYETYVPNILVGLFTHFNFNGFMSFEAHFPSHMALVFFKFRFKPENLLNSFTIFNAFSTEVTSEQKKFVSSANWRISWEFDCWWFSLNNATGPKIFLHYFPGPPCPSGWSRFNSYCYLVSSSIKTWHQAQAYCRGLKGELVKINSADENEFVHNLVNQQAPTLKRVWIALNWDSILKVYLWSDLSVPVYTNWAPSEPNGFAKEPCGHMYTSGHRGATGYWNDLPCRVIPSWPCGLVCKRLP